METFKRVYQMRDRHLNLTTLGLLNVSLHYPIYQIGKTLSLQQKTEHLLL